MELVAETLRSALNEIALAAREWLLTVAEPDWFRHYATRAEDTRFPKSRAKRDGMGLRIGMDGTRLLEAVLSLPGRPANYERWSRWKRCGSMGPALPPGGGRGEAPGPKGPAAGRDAPGHPV